MTTPEKPPKSWYVACLLCDGTAVVECPLIVYTDWGHIMALRPQTPENLR